MTTKNLNIQFDSFLNPTVKKENVKFNYNINNIANIDYKNITCNSKTKIFVCIFKIITSNKNKNIYNPFLKYLLYKYPTSNNTTTNLFTFPFKKYDKKKTPLVIANDLVYTITNIKLKNIGFLQNDNDIYFFYENLDNFHNVVNIVKSQQFWWCLIDEICNHKKVINFPIHKNTYNIFYKNPNLIYLTNNEDKYIEIPSCGYIGSSSNIIPYVASFGIKSNLFRTFGPYYYFGNFKRMVFYAGWHSNYTKRIMFDKVVSDENGKYKQGGIIRFALFLGNSKIILYRKTDPFYNYIKFYDTSREHDISKTKKMLKDIENYKGKWTTYYDSLILGNIKNKNISGFFNINVEYIIKNFNQQVPLSVHLIDMKTLKETWDPTYDYYKIL
jgi:hypothetical protein